jgi:ubiquinone/menaquinone biosynthesis C-methylase UbiE
MKDSVIENRKRYVERVAFYRGFGYDLERERDFIIDSAIPFSGEILEIGTGKGHFALALAKRGFNFISIDKTDEEQRMAFLNLCYWGLDTRVTLKIENAERLSFSDKSFDVVFSINVFHHLEDPIAVLNEITRVVRPAGKIVLSDFTEKGLSIINACHTHEGRTHDCNRHGLDEAKRHFIKKGFGVVETQSETQKVIIAVR